MRQNNLINTLLEPQIREAITKFCIKIIREPLTYFSEADCQQILIEELKQIESLRKSYPTSVPRGKSSKSYYKTPLIHREYGGGEGTRFDVVILAHSDVKRIDNPNLTIGKRYIKPLYAFELGTEKTSNTAAHLKNDLSKLSRNVKEVGYIIHFYRDTTVSTTGTSMRDKTEDKIERTFKTAFTDKKMLGIEKVKILPILIRTGRNQPHMIGKCEIFDGTKWAKVNIRRPEKLRKAILERLK